MTLALIVGIIVIFYIIFGAAKRKERSITYHNTNRGSREVERQEWEHWIKKLYDEYCELAGITFDFSEYNINPFEVEVNSEGNLKFGCRLGEIFGDNRRFFYNIYRIKDENGILSKPKLVSYYRDPFPRFTDKAILEKLRIKYSLPSDYELKGTPYNQGYNGKSNYESLYNVMYFCVRKAVVERGYKYGGIDFEARESNYQKFKSTESKHDWLNNKPKK